MKELLISFSGGRTSAFMARMIQVSPFYKDYKKHFVYANTGKERQETLDFVKAVGDNFNIPIVWVEAVINPEIGKGTRHKVVDYESAIVNTDKDQPIWDAMIKKYGLPTNAFPYCTRELKDAAIRSYMRSINLKKGDYLTAIGIRADEVHRKNKYFYPLIDLNIDLKCIREFWERQSFDLGLKDYEGNCDLCFKKSKKKRLTILKNNPEWGDFWAKKEGIHRGQDVVFDREGLSISQLKNIAQSAEFKPSMDAYELSALQKDLFDSGPRTFDWELETDCFCKNGGMLDDI